MTLRKTKKPKPLEPPTECSKSPGYTININYHYPDSPTGGKHNYVELLVPDMDVMFILVLNSPVNNVISIGTESTIWKVIAKGLGDSKCYVCLGL